MTNNEERDLERLLPGLEPPPPSASLRVRAVAAARERMAAAPAPDLWWRIWNNRGIRLAWAAAVVLLMAGHVLVNPDLGAVFSLNPQVLAGNVLDEQLQDILQPMWISADVRPIVGLSTDGGDPSNIENGGNPS